MAHCECVNLIILLFIETSQILKIILVFHIFKQIFFINLQVIQIDPLTGELLQTINLPSLQITSVAFGGPNLNEMYVTSANLRLTAKDLKKYPSPGCTFRITGLGVKGLPGQRVVL